MKTAIKWQLIYTLREGKGIAASTLRNQYTENDSQEWVDEEKERTLIALTILRNIDSLARPKYRGISKPQLLDVHFVWFCCILYNNKPIQVDL